MNIIRTRSYEKLPNGEEVLIGSGEWLLIKPITAAKTYRGYTILHRAIPEDGSPEPWKRQCNPKAYHCYKEEWTPEDQKFFILDVDCFTSRKELIDAIDFWEDRLPGGYPERAIRERRISQAMKVLLHRLTDVEIPPQLEPQHMVECYMRATCMVACVSDSSTDFLQKTISHLAKEEASK